MTVKELITKYEFDELLPYMTAQYYDEKKFREKHKLGDIASLANIRELYDMIRHTEPDMSRMKYDEKMDIDGTHILTREEMVETMEYELIPMAEYVKTAEVYWRDVYKRGKQTGKRVSVDCDYLNMKLEYNIGREVVFNGEEFDEKDAAAQALYSIMHIVDNYYYLPEHFFARKADYERSKNNKYKEEASKYFEKLHVNYLPHRYRKNPQKGWVIFAIPVSKLRKRVKEYSKKYGKLESFYEDMYLQLYRYDHIKHRNRMKRMRDRRHRLKMNKLHRMEDADLVIGRITDLCPSVPREKLEWMLEAQQISEERFCSRAYDAARRMDYLWESLTVYTDPHKEPFTKTVIVFRTSHEHPLTDAERKILDRIAALYGDPSQVKLYIGTEPSLGVEADLYIVRVKI